MHEKSIQMTRSDVKRLAQAAGFNFPEEESTGIKGMITRLERFARLVQSQGEQSQSGGAQ